MTAAKKKHLSSLNGFMHDLSAFKKIRHQKMDPNNYRFSFLHNSTGKGFSSIVCGRLKAFSDNPVSLRTFKWIGYLTITDFNPLWDVSEKQTCIILYWYFDSFWFYSKARNSKMPLVLYCGWMNFRTNVPNNGQFQFWIAFIARLLFNTLFD